MTPATSPAGDPGRQDRARRLRAEAILAAYHNSEPVLSPDGRQVLFISHRGGVPEAYLSDVSDPPAREAEPHGLLNARVRVARDPRCGAGPVDGQRSQRGLPRRRSRVPAEWERCRHARSADSFRQPGRPDLVRRGPGDGQPGGRRHRRCAAVAQRSAPGQRGSSPGHWSG